MTIKLTKEQLIGICLIFSLCVLVLGMTKRYNNLVEVYNEAVDEINLCRERESIGRTPNIFLPLINITEDNNG